MMNIVLYLLLPAALLLSFFFVLAFVLSVRAGQYDDLDTPANRILLEDD